MPQNKMIFFHDQTKQNQIPDLSLHISLPNSAPSSICTTNNYDQRDNSTNSSSPFDIWRVEEDADNGIGLIKSHSDGSIKGTSPQYHHHNNTDTELSLSNPITTPSEAESPWRRRNFVRAREEEGVNSEKGVNVIRPFNGLIPLYGGNNSSSIVENNKDSKFSLYAVPYPSSCSATPYNSDNNNNSAIVGGVKPISRFNGITMESLRSQQFQYLNNHHYQHQHHLLQQQQQFGMIGSSDFTNGFVRSSSRMLPTITTRQQSSSKRNMRAPRMRWTSSLHNRFVHAVELLGGHESESLALYLCVNTNRCIFSFQLKNCKNTLKSRITIEFFSTNVLLDLNIYVLQLKTKYALV